MTIVTIERDLKPGFSGKFRPQQKLAVALLVII